MKDFLNFISDQGFMPHGHCYLWQPEVLWLHVISDALITLAYYMIPLMLMRFLIKRRDVPFSSVIGLFIAFIFLCGTTHLIAMITNWYPAYRLEGWVKLLTASVSMVTALVLIPIIPQFINFPGMKEKYEQLLAEHQKVKSEKEQLEALSSASFDREKSIVDLKDQVNALLNELGRPPKFHSDMTSS